MTRPSASKVASRFTKRTAARYYTQTLVDEIFKNTLLDENGNGDDLKEVPKRIQRAVDDFVKDVARECAGMVVEEVFIPSTADEEVDDVSFAHEGGSIIVETTYPSQVAFRSSIELDIKHMLSMCLRAEDLNQSQVDSDVLDAVDDLVVEILSDEDNWKNLDLERTLSDEQLRELSSVSDVTIPIVTTIKSYDASGRPTAIQVKDLVVEVFTLNPDVLTVNVRGGGAYTLEVSADVTVNVE